MISRTPVTPRPLRQNPESVTHQGPRTKRWCGPSPRPKRLAYVYVALPLEARCSIRNPRPSKFQFDQWNKQCILNSVVRSVLRLSDRRALRQKSCLSESCLLTLEIKYYVVGCLRVTYLEHRSNIYSLLLTYSILSLQSVNCKL